MSLLSIHLLRWILRRCIYLEIATKLYDSLSKCRALELVEIVEIVRKCMKVFIQEERVWIANHASRLYSYFEMRCWNCVCLAGYDSA